MAPATDQTSGGVALESTTLARGMMKLRSGRSLRDTFIGLQRDRAGTFRVGEGYDDEVEGAALPPLDDGVDRERWTADEQRELADAMIALWTEYRTHIPED